LPTPDELLRAPELAILSALETLLNLALVAIVAAQPELQATADGHDAVRTDAANSADCVIAKAQTLAVAIADYRATRLHGLTDLPH
jgi:hypothetical protein